MLILTIDAALPRCSTSVIRDGRLVCQRIVEVPRGQSALLAPMAEAVLTEAEIGATELDGVAVTVGPGSFTGLRAAIALAHGIALAAGCVVVGITMGEAMAEAIAVQDGRALWTAIDSRRGRVFLDRGKLDGADDISAYDLAALPVPIGPVTVGGDAAEAVVAALAAAGTAAERADPPLPSPLHIARAAMRRMSGALRPRAAQPLYVDPPEAKLPAGGLRPQPV
jgi:tRNA threonylcarbamoyladenosine biosynthesis protein TsaB